MDGSKLPAPASSSSEAPSQRSLNPGSAPNGNRSNADSAPNTQPPQSHAAARPGPQNIEGQLHRTHQIAHNEQQIPLPASSLGRVQVPNPLGVAPVRPDHKLPVARVPVAASGGTNAVGAPVRSKLPLSAPAKEALAKAIWSAIRSPTGTIAPDLMEDAMKTGLPRHAILNAAKVAREREALKARGSANQASTSASSLPPGEKSGAAPAHRGPTSSSSVSAQKAALQAREMKEKLQQRSMWKRTQHGVFMTQKERYVAIPFSVGPISRSTNTSATVVSSSLPTKMLGERLRLAASIQSTLVVSEREPLLDHDRCKRQKNEAKKFANALARNARKVRQTLADSINKQHKGEPRQIPRDVSFPFVLFVFSHLH